MGSATTDRDGSATINSVSINGGSNQAHVSPGATFTVEFNYWTVCSGGSCRIAIQLGLNVSMPQACFYADVKKGSKTLTLKAPASPDLRAGPPPQERAYLQRERRIVLRHTPS